MNLKNISTPPYKREYSRIIAIVLALLIVIAGGSGFAFVSHNAQQSHAAGIIYKDLPNGAPKQGILIDDISKFWTIPHEFYTTNPNLKEIDIWNETAKAVIYDGVTNNTQIIPGYQHMPFHIEMEQQEHGSIFSFSSTNQNQTILLASMIKFKIHSIISTTEPLQMETGFFNIQILMYVGQTIQAGLKQLCSWKTTYQKCM